MKRELKTELDREMVIGQIKRLDLSKPHTVEILTKRKVRSISQNSLYWLWMTCIEFETGTNRDELHDYFKHKFILPIEVNVFGEKIMRWTTTDKDTLKFKEYLDKIQIFALTDLSISLPDPEDNYWDEFYSFYVAKL
jgi:hypothetical protein